MFILFCTTYGYALNLIKTSCYMNWIDLCELLHVDEFCRVNCCVTFDQVGEYVIVDYAY